MRVDIWHGVIFFEIMLFIRKRHLHEENLGFHEVCCFEMNKFLYLCKELFKKYFLI
jgi:hypothetical protein